MSEETNNDSLLIESTRKNVVSNQTDKPNKIPSQFTTSSGQEIKIRSEDNQTLSDGGSASNSNTTNE